MTTAFYPSDDPNIMAAWAEIAPASAVANFIAAREHAEITTDFNRVFPEEFLQTALKRDDALITLSLASHCDDPRTLGEIWQRAADDSLAARALRQSILSNPHACPFLPHDEWLAFHLNASLDEIHLYCQKSCIKEHQLAEIVTGAGPYADLPESRRLLWSLIALRNPNLRRVRQRDENDIDDGWEAHQERLPFNAAFKLLESVPVTRDNASWLSNGFDNIQEWYPPREASWIVNVLERWTVPEEESTQAEKRKGSVYPGTYAGLRMRIAQLVPPRSGWREFIETHPDKSVRIGALHQKDFKTAEDVTSAIERDGFLALYNMPRNCTLHHRDHPEVVEAFRSAIGRAYELSQAEGILWEQARYVLDAYRDEANRLHSEYPSHFVGYDEQGWEEKLRHNDIDVDEIPETQRQWFRRFLDASREKGEQALPSIMLAERVAQISAGATLSRTLIERMAERFDALDTRMADATKPAQPAASDDFGFGTKIALFAAGCALSFAGILYTGWCFSLLWLWFVTPLGAPELALYQAIGMLFIVGLLRGIPRKTKAEEEEEANREWYVGILMQRFGNYFSRPTWILIASYAIKSALAY